MGYAAIVREEERPQEGCRAIPEDQGAARVQVNLTRKLVAEALGTALLLATVVGSGIMGETLAGGNVAIALLANTLATGRRARLPDPDVRADLGRVTSIRRSRSPTPRKAAYRGATCRATSSRRSRARSRASQSRTACSASPCSSRRSMCARAARSSSANSSRPSACSRSSGASCAAARAPCRLPSVRTSPRPTGSRRRRRSPIRPSRWRAPHRTRSRASAPPMRRDSSLRSSSARWRRPRSSAGSSRR